MDRTFTASQVAHVLGEEIRNLRMWRLRGLCDLGQSGRHWKYTPADICKMAVALAMRDVGLSLEPAFNFSSGHTDVSKAIDVAMAGDWSKIDGRFIIVGRTYHFDGTRGNVIKIATRADLDATSITERVKDFLDGGPMLSKSIIDLEALVKFVFVMLPATGDEPAEGEVDE